MNKICKNIMAIMLISGLTILSFTSHRVNAEERTIVLATVNWEPMFGENLPKGGFYTEITRQAFQRVGYGLKVEFVPWKRALESARKGKYGGLLGAYYSEERTQDFLYSELVYVDEVVFFRRKGEPPSTYQSLRDLIPYSIGVTRGLAYIDSLKEEEPSLKLIEVNDTEQNIKKLVRKRIDLFPAGKVYILHMLQTRYPDWKDQIQTVSPPFKEEGLYNPISKNVPDHQTIVTDFNRGLQMIKDDGTFHKILNEYGFGEK